MLNRVLIVVGVVILGVLIGVGVVIRRGPDPILATILERQNEILAQQKAALTVTEAGGSVTLKELNARLAKLEAEVNNLKSAPQPRPERQGPPPEDLTRVYDIPAAHSAVKGPKEAPVTIVEFVDFECPFCARFHKPVLEALAAYPEKVNYMVKHFPLSFHPNARPAAKAALAAGEQGKFFEMADALLENGRNLRPETYEKLAGDLKLDVARFKADLQKNDARYEDIIDKDLELGAEVDVRGTPTMYLNGRKTAARDLARFRKEIDAVLENK
jgi:protein-disulfide isomerase